MSMTLETGPRDADADASVMDRVLFFSVTPFPIPYVVGTSYGSDDGLPGDAIRPAIIGDPISEFCT